MPILQARNLTIADVERLLGFQKRRNGRFESFLSLPEITEVEEQELLKIQEDFERYLDEDASEGQVKLVAIAPLLRLAGFYNYPIQIKVENNIDSIEIEDEKGITIAGRFDIIAINKQEQIADNVYFWVLAIESKRSAINAVAGLPQLLTYAYKSLEYQEAVWGLTTNGMHYQFVYIQQGNPPIYLSMPILSLLELESGLQLLQVLKAISQL
ncbi:hypothetical protein [Gloeothece verrucosa]|uniref:Restriction endonuclease, type I, EcoRI, R subunit/Type III n=1 Tax=Gloeothece verrucosa (strain PCC 7822) TaxID=497965 RepID=E0UFB7_GLOV7|nr:hypothetical protein [Gloeothece verrucosa]ADN15488.1 conserved hypothetical protein [Gloeothece verrucosa PCC 7822]